MAKKSSTVLATLKGIVSGCGINDANTAAGHVDVMKKAYELGKEL